jgi:hypothetical protein
MRKTLIALTALAGLIGVGFASTASAATPTFAGAPLVQNVQYYGGPYYGHRWHHHYWHHRYWHHYRGW